LSDFLFSPSRAHAPVHTLSGGDLTNTDNVMNNTFWIGVQPSLTQEMLEFAARKIETYLGVNF
jgi:dTDP-4-amino-4,6-dideoxygalactose transaminase